MTTRTGSPGSGAAIATTSAHVVRLKGRDARRFCNGMFTNNVRDLPVGRWNRSAIVDDRARVGGFLDLLCEAPDTFLAVLDGLDQAAFLERFEKYVVFDDVELTTPDLVRWVLVGLEAREILRAAGLPSPEGPAFAVDADRFVWAHRRWDGPSWDVLAPPGAPLFAGVAELPPGELELLRIRARIPSHPADTDEKRLPHELGVREEMLHFEKGCYVGQETIHRVDVMGQVRRRLVRVVLDGAVSVGSRVLDAAGAELGKVTSVATNGDGTEALSTIKLPFDAPDTEVVAADGERRVHGRVA